MLQASGTAIASAAVAAAAPMLGRQPIVRRGIRPGAAATRSTSFSGDQLRTRPVSVAVTCTPALYTRLASGTPATSSMMHHSKIAAGQRHRLSRQIHGARCGASASSANSRRAAGDYRERNDGRKHESAPQTDGGNVLR